jgi:predicted Zn-dependent peptidase
MPLKHTVEEIQLKNGAKGLLIDIPDATVVAYDVHFRAGNYYSPDVSVQQTGHILEHMVFGSTKKYPSVEAFSQEFTKNGAYNNATTWQYNMSYYGDCAVLEWDRILDLQRQAITEPAFTQKLLTAEKGNVSEELTGQANNHGRLLWQSLHRAMGDPLFTDSEKLQTVQAVQLSDIQQHHKRTHTLKNMRFSFAGDLGKHGDEIIAMLESWKLPVGERLTVPMIPLTSTKPVFIYRQDLPSIIFALHISLNRKLSEQEQVAMGAVNHMLSGTFHSRIWGEARTRGICYGMNSSSDVEIDGTSSWEFTAQIRPQNAKEMLTLIVDQLKKVAEGDISAKELDESKQYALGGHQMRGQTVRSVNNWYAGYYFDTDKIDPMDKSPDDIKAVTRTMIKSLVSEFLQQGDWGLGVIGNSNEAEVAELDKIIATILKER